MRFVSLYGCVFTFQRHVSGVGHTIYVNDVFVYSGGLSNWLYHVKLLKNVSGYAESNPREVLLRLYGQSHGECSFQHVLTESIIFALLSERKLGPRLYGVFAGGRIEEYIPVSVHLFPAPPRLGPPPPLSRKRNRKRKREPA